MTQEIMFHKKPVIEKSGAADTHGTIQMTKERAKNFLKNVERFKGMRMLTFELELRS